MVRTTERVRRVIGAALRVRWSVLSHERAVANARSASVECSRRLLERLEVELAVERLRNGADRPETATRLAH